MWNRSDQPLTDPEQDRFQRWPFACSVASTIADRRTTDPLVIGLYGPWGEGKTTVLNYIELALRTRVSPSPFVVPFNPWRYGDETTLLTQFFEALATAIGAEIRTGGDKVASLLRQYGAGLAAVAGRSDDLEALAQATGKTTVDDLRRRIADALAHFDGSVVVLADDIDRLRRRDVQLLFRLVALTAGFPRTTYVLAFDPLVVADALTEEYGYEDERAGLKFLEKIIQVPLPIPQVEQADLRVMCGEGIQFALERTGISLEEREARRLAKDLTDCVQPLLQTARTAKRIGRVLEFLLPLVKDEVNASDFILLEALHVLLPEVHGEIIRNTGFFVRGAAGLIINEKEHKDRGEQFFEELLKSYEGPERAAVEKLLRRLFPAAVGLPTPSWYAGSPDTWMREQRVCSQEYFLRYVTYAVRPGDIADAQIAQMLAGAVQQPASLETALGALLDTNSPDKVLTRLRLRVEESSPALARALVTAVAGTSPKLEVEWPLFSFGLKPRSQGALLILEALRELPFDERGPLLLETMRQCPSVALVHEVLAWTRSAEAREINAELLDGATVDALGELLVERVRELASHSAYFLPEVGASIRLLVQWAASDQAAASAYLEAAIRQDPARIDDLLTRLMSRTTDDDGRIVYLDFSSNGFDALKTVISPESIEPYVRKRFGITEETVPYAEHRELEHPARAGRQLLALIQADRASASPASE